MFYRLRELIGPSMLRMIFLRHFNRVVTMIGIMMIISLVSWGAKARLSASAGRSSPAPGARLSVVSQSGPREKAPVPTNIQVETFTLGYYGFEPKRINRTPGPFVLGINNYQRLPNASFELLREDGHRLHEIKVSKGRVRYRKLINLPPGSYLLKEINNADWTAQITIGK